MHRYALAPGGHGFDPRLWHTKVVKNDTSCSSLGTQTYGVELGLDDTVLGLCDWVWYHIKCLGHDTSVRQHYKSEHWAPCRNQALLWYDRKIVEIDIKYKQKTTTMPEPSLFSKCLDLSQTFKRAANSQLSLSGYTYIWAISWDYGTFRPP